MRTYFRNYAARERELVKVLTLLLSEPLKPPLAFSRRRFKTHGIGDAVFDSGAKNIGLLGETTKQIYSTLIIYKCWLLVPV